MKLTKQKIYSFIVILFLCSLPTTHSYAQTYVVGNDTIIVTEIDNDDVVEKSFVVQFNDHTVAFEQSSLLDPPMVDNQEFILSFYNGSSVNDRYFINFTRTNSKWIISKMLHGTESHSGMGNCVFVEEVNKVFDLPTSFDSLYHSISSEEIETYYDCEDYFPIDSILQDIKLSYINDKNIPHMYLHYDEWELYLQHSTVSADNYKTYIDVAYYFVESDNFDLAELIMGKTKKYNNKYELSYLITGDILYNKNETEKAIQYYRKYIKQSKTNNPDRVFERINEY